MASISYQEHYWVSSLHGSASDFIICQFVAVLDGVGVLVLEIVLSGLVWVAKHMSVMRAGSLRNMMSTIPRMCQWVMSKLEEQ
jgi:uncharacterized membrane protein YciS (DUF1049 family)